MPRRIIRRKAFGNTGKTERLFKRGYPARPPSGFRRVRGIEIFTTESEKAFSAFFAQKPKKGEKIRELAGPFFRSTVGDMPSYLSVKEITAPNGKKTYRAMIHNFVDEPQHEIDHIRIIMIHARHNVYVRPKSLLAVLEELNLGNVSAYRSKSSKNIQTQARSFLLDPLTYLKKQHTDSVGKIIGNLSELFPNLTEYRRALYTFISRKGTQEWIRELNAIPVRVSSTIEIVLYPKHFERTAKVTRKVLAWFVREAARSRARARNKH